MGELPNIQSMGHGLDGMSFNWSIFRGKVSQKSIQQNN